MGFKQKVFSDAGVITPPTFLTKEIFDQSSATGPKQFYDGYTEVPRRNSRDVIHESKTFAVNNAIVESMGHRLTIADGEVRPGNRSYHQH